MLDRLKNIREEKLSNITKYSNGKMSLEKLSKFLKITGYVGGAVGSFLYDAAVKPIAKDVNEKIIKPVDNWINDKLNDIGDWWDSLCR